MGLNTLLASNQIHYGSTESLEVIDIYAMMVKYYSLKTSNKIAIETKSPFHGFEKSKYADGSHLDEYLKGYDYTPKTEKVAKMFEKHYIPTLADWEELKTSIMVHGIYSAYLTAVAP